MAARRQPSPYSFHQTRHSRLTTRIQGEIKRDRNWESRRRRHYLVCQERRMRYARRAHRNSEKDLVLSELRKYSRGFTLIELMFVVVIVMVLASVAVASYLGFMRQARIQEWGEILSAHMDLIGVYSVFSLKVKIKDHPPKRPFRMLQSIS